MMGGFRAVSEKGYGSLGAGFYTGRTSIESDFSAKEDCQLPAMGRTEVFGWSDLFPLRTIVKPQKSFAQSNVFWRHLDQFVIGDKLNCLFE